MMITKWIRLIILSFVLFGLGAPATLAHQNESIAYSDISFEDGVIKYVLQIDMYDIRVATTPDDPDIGSSTPEVLERFTSASQAEVENYVLSKIQLYADNFLLKGKLTQLHTIERVNESQPFAEAVLEYPVKNIPKRFVMEYHLVFESDQWHVNFVDLAIGDLKKSVVMVNEIQELQVGEMSLQYTFKKFFLLGLGHGLTGFEAIIFAIAFLIGCKSVKQTLVVTVSFVVANLLTLTLTGLHILTLPAQLIEIVIALSILSISLYTLFKGNEKYRLWLVGGFGLFYGSGFAEVFSRMKGDNEHYVSSLMSISGGIEVGLCVIVLILYPAIHYARKIKWILPLCLITFALFGFVWFMAKLYQ